MKKQIKKGIALLLGVTLLLGGTTTSCKKGANDPALSLKSRKARLTGDWQLINYESKEISKNANGETTEVNITFDMDNSLLKRVETLNGTLVSEETKDYSEKISFTKKGEYTLKYIDQKIEGNWAFIHKNKSTGLKNKEAVLLSDSKVTYDDGTVEEWTTDKIFADGILAIDRLTNNEMVVKADVSGGYGSNTLTRNETFTYVKVK